MPDTGLKSPTAEGDDYTGYTNPTNAYASDNVDTWPSGAAAAHDWHDFAFGLSPSDTIVGIEVLVEGAQFSPGGTTTVGLEVSYDGGANYTTSGKTVGFIGTTDTTETAGGAADLWGRAWSASEFSDANFRLRLTNVGTKREDIDHLQVRIHYTTTVTEGYAAVF